MGYLGGIYAAVITNLWSSANVSDKDKLADMAFDTVGNTMLS